MANLLATIEISQWMWASWENPPFSMGDTTGEDCGLDNETIERIHSDLPTLTISYGGTDYEVTGQPSMTNNYRYGTHYGDITFVEYPFYIQIDPVQSDPSYPVGVHVRLPMQNPGTVVITMSEAEDDNDCGYHLNVVLNPPDEPSGGCCDTAQITIAVSDWANNEATKTVTGVTADNTVIVSPDPVSADVYAEAGILCTAQAANSLTFTCDTVPSSDVTVNIVIV